MATVPGPRFTLPWTSLRRMRRDPLAFLSEIASYGPVAHVRIARQDIFLFTDPAGIEDVLVTHASSFKKGRALERAKRTLGDGLLTSEGPAHLRQRRLMQPAFHKARIAQYAAAMTRASVAMRERWRPGEPLDLATEMNRLTLGIVTETLFGANVGSESDTARVQQAITDVLEMVDLVLVPLADWLVHLPLPRMRRFHAAQKALDRVIYGIIEDRRRSGADRGDLLSMLLQAQDAEDGVSMSDEQIRDQVLTLFLAGHETTANALAWTWVLLARHRDVERHVHREIDAVLGDRIPAFDDLPRLPYTRAVVSESMRLYPPAWTIGRRALVDYRWAGYDVPAGSIVLMSQWVVHRDPRLWPEPDRFDPERWLPEPPPRPRFAYFPFGGGNRMCIGDQFAWTEAMLVLVTIAQRWRVKLDPLHPIEPLPLITLRTRHGVRATPWPRHPAGVR